MKLTTVPSTIMPGRSYDWIVGGEKIGKISEPTDEGGCWIAQIQIDDQLLGAYTLVTATGKTRETAAENCLRRMSMVSLGVAQTYTKIVTEVNK